VQVERHKKNGARRKTPVERHNKKGGRRKVYKKGTIRKAQ
jgi:hypothetical protein